MLGVKTQPGFFVTDRKSESAELNLYSPWLQSSLPIDWKYGWVCGSSSQNPDSITCGGPECLNSWLFDPFLLLIWLINYLLILLFFLTIVCLWNVLKWPSASLPCKFSPWDRIAGLCVYPYTHSESCQTGLSSVLWFLLCDTELGDKNISLLTGDYWGPALPAPGVPISVSWPRSGLQFRGRKLPSTLLMVRGWAYQPQDPDLWHHWRPVWTV